MALAFQPQVHRPHHADAPYGVSCGVQTIPGARAGALTGATPGATWSRRPLQAVYWRRRLMAALVVLVALYMMWLIAVVVGQWMVTTADASDTATLAPPMVHVVEPGDTLWSVASGLDVDGDLREIVAALAKANGGPGLRPGQTLDLAPAFG